MTAEYFSRIDKKKIKQILVINLGGIGDVLLSTPALRAIAEYYPEARLNLLVVPRVTSLAKTLPYIKEVHVWHLHGAYSMLINFFMLLRLRNRKIDLGINMRTIVSERSAKKVNLLFRIINPKIKAGRNTEGWGSFFAISIPETERGEKFEMEYDIDLACALGAKATDKNLDIPLDAASVETINLIFRYHHFEQNDIIIGIHPGGNPTHRWPAENFTQVIKEISKEFPHAKFVITGDKSEVNLGEVLARANPKTTYNLAGKLGILEVCALIKKTALFIANDTGIMHIAAALNTPLIAIFGPGYLTRFDPRNISGNAAVLYKKTECAPCNLPACDTLECLKHIEPEEVTVTALKILKKHAY